MADQKPYILLLSLANQPLYNQLCSGLIDALAEHAIVKRASTYTGAVRYISKNDPKAIVSTDAAITHPKMREAFEGLVDYVANGGTAIFACHFGSFIKPIFMDAFWLGFGKLWKTGDKVRTTVHLNDAGVAKLKGKGEHLAPKFSTNATFLRGVDTDDALYLPAADSVVEANVWRTEAFVKVGAGAEKAGQPVAKTQTPVVFAKYGSGHIGYVGDHHTGSEEGSQGEQGDCSIGAILAMCEL